MPALKMILLLGTEPRKGIMITDKLGVYLDVLETLREILKLSQCYTKFYYHKSISVFDVILFIIIGTNHYTIVYLIGHVFVTLAIVLGIL